MNKKQTERLTLTRADIEKLRMESDIDEKAISRAESFLKLTTEKGSKELSPETLTKIGKQLENPTDLITNKNFLNVMNARRTHLFWLGE